MIYVLLASASALFAGLLLRRDRRRRDQRRRIRERRVRSELAWREMVAKTSRNGSTRP